MYGVVYESLNSCTRAHFCIPGVTVVPRDHYLQVTGPKVAAVACHHIIPGVTVVRLWLLYSGLNSAIHIIPGVTVVRLWLLYANISYLE